MTTRPQTSWYAKAIDAAASIDVAHTTPWKLASTYALLAIAENLLSRGHDGCIPARAENAPAESIPFKDQLLGVEEVATLTRISPGTLRYFRSADLGPKSFRLSRRVRYRREDVERWIDEAAKKTVRGG